MLDPTSQLDRFEDKARREEARAMDKQQLGDSSLDLWFEQLESPRDMAEIEARLAVPRGA